MSARQHLPRPKAIGLAVAVALVVVTLPGSAAAINGARADNPDVAVDAAGNAIAVWEYADGSDNRIQAAYRPAGADWGAPRYISAPGQETGYPRVVVAPTGDAIAVWERIIDSGPRLQYNVQAAVRPAGGVWGPPEDLSPVGFHFGDPHIALDAAGDAVAVWVRSDGPFEIVQASDRPAGGSWQPPQDLSRPTEYASGPQVAVDPAGDAVVTWQASASYHQMETAQASVRPAGGAWSPPEDISTVGALTPQVSVDAAGNAIAVWLQGNRSLAAYRPAGGTWSAPEEIAATDGVFVASIAQDPAGNAMAAWMLIDGRGQRVQAAVRPAGGPWGPPEDLSSTGVSFYPEISIDAAGNATVLWLQYDGGDAVVKARTRPAGGEWESPADLSPVPGRSDLPKLAVGANGDAVAVWRLHAGSLALVQAARRRAGGAWGTPQELTEPFRVEPLPDCVVPRLLGKTLARARVLIIRTECLLGRVSRAYSRRVKRGRVLSQRPRPYKIVAAATRIDLVVSRGRRR